MIKEDFTVGKYAQRIIAQQGLPPNHLMLIPQELQEREITGETAREISLAIGRIHRKIWVGLMKVLDGKSEKEIRQLIARTEEVTEEEVGPDVFPFITSMRLLGRLELGVGYPHNYYIPPFG